MFVVSPAASGDECEDHFPSVVGANSHNVKTQLEIVLDNLDHIRMAVARLMSEPQFHPRSTWG